MPLQTVGGCCSSCALGTPMLLGTAAVAPCQHAPPARVPRCFSNGRVAQRQPQNRQASWSCAAGSNGNGAPVSEGSLELELQQYAFEDFSKPFRGPAQRPKQYVFLRHGHSTWNEESRIQGNTDESQLTAKGRLQAEQARVSLSRIDFDSCFSSPHKRARQTGEVVWQGHEASGRPVEYLDSLREADLGWFQGLRNEDIARSDPELYRVWRDTPEEFCLDGRYPVADAFHQARRAWHDMAHAPGSCHLIITHKSILRALLCTALGLPPGQFRAIDVANAAVCMVRCDKHGAMRLSALNLTAHLDLEEVYYAPPAAANSKNDGLVMSERAKAGTRAR